MISVHARLTKVISTKISLPSYIFQYLEAPLHAAAYNGDLTTVRILIEHNADVNTRDKVC